MNAQQTMTPEVPDPEVTVPTSDLDLLLETMSVLRVTEMDILEVAGESSSLVITTSDVRFAYWGKGHCIHCAKGSLCPVSTERMILLSFILL